MAPLAVVRHRSSSSHSLRLRRLREPRERRIVRGARRIRAAGRRAGTLALHQDVAHLVSVGAQLIYYHADPFLVAGVKQMRATAEEGLKA